MINHFFDTITSFVNRSEEVYTYQTGVHTTGARTIEKADDLLVVVHPFFIEKYANNLDIIPSAKVYVPKLETLVATHKGPIITFEEAQKLNETAMRYKQAKRKDNSYFIKTDNSDSSLRELSWDDVIEFIKSFNPKTLKLAGGFLHNQSARGCLGHIGEVLAKNGLWIRILEDCTFSYAPTEEIITIN